MNFGQKLRKLREEKKITQQELAGKLGRVSNSYIAEVERGTFIPSEQKLKKLAKAMKVSFKELKHLLLESKIEELGIKDKELKELFLDVPCLPKKDKQKVIQAYIKIKEKRK